MSAEFEKTDIDLMLATKAIIDRDARHGLINPDRMRFTIEARAEESKRLVDGGMSQRQAAKVLGVSHQTVGRDVVQNGPKDGPECADGVDRALLAQSDQGGPSKLPLSNMELQPLKQQAIAAMEALAKMEIQFSDQPTLCGKLRAARGELHRIVILATAKPIAK